MERRLAAAWAAGITVSVGLATVTLAAVGGANMLGLGSGHHRIAAPASQATEVQTIDEIVVVTGTTTPAPAAQAPADTPTGGPVGAVGNAPWGTPAPTTAAPPRTGAPTSPPATQGTTATTPAGSVTTGAPTTATTAAPTTQAPTTVTTAPPTTAPRTTTPRTTVPIYTTTGDTLPPGARIPSDWPPGKPVPPIPPGCSKPVLEDNGVWNCG